MFEFKGRKMASKMLMNLKGVAKDTSNSLP